MKKWTGFLLALTVALTCVFPVYALAENETGGSVDVTMQVPLPTNTGSNNDTGPSPDSGSDNADDTPAYSYVVNIPSSFTITNSNNAFSISASRMDIPEGKEVVVRLDRAATLEADGNLYFYLDGNRNSEHFLQCNIARQGDMGLDMNASADGILASFRSGELIPYDWQYIVLMYNYEEYMQASEGTYCGTIHYTIGLE